MIEFRRTTGKDADLIVRTRQIAWAATYRGIYTDEVIDGFDFEKHTQLELRRQNDSKFFSYVVMDGEDCIGYFSFGSAASGGFRLHSLYLLPCAQKQGLGSRIFSFVRQTCLAMGYKSMYLDCHPQNLNALAFYQHMGGKITNVDAEHENPQEDSCTLEFLFT